LIFIALGMLGLALLVTLGRQPWLARGRNRYAAFAAAAVAATAAAWDAARGGWIGGSVLLSVALWLVTSAWGPRRTRSNMGMAEAAATLGVAESAGRDEIEAAYRRLMLRVHPDTGGAAGLAAQLNAARDVLLKR
jgi:hypothetical protein